MKLTEVILYRMIYNSSDEGILFFIPSKIEGNEITGYSIYIPNEEDSEASAAAGEYIPREGDTVYLGGIDRIHSEGPFRGKLDLLRVRP